MKYLALILCLFPAISLYSQRVYTLNDCIDHALQENVKRSMWIGKQFNWKHRSIADFLT